MRVAVLSDIHANLRALDAILARIGSVDAIWHLGDVVGYGPDPDAVVDRLRELGASGVQGNHDLAATGDDVIRDFNVDARAAMEWTRRTIAPATREWLAALPARLTIGAYNLVHGSPLDPTWEYIVTDSIALANLAAMPTDWGLFGHTHLPWAYLAAGAGAVTAIEPATGDRLGLAGRRALVNPGSVGQPRDGDPDASALVLDTEEAEVSWVRAPYDVRSTQRAMRAARLPARGIERIAQGF
jgi:diadenosine tetraphosphatase ApaH/serine/threonine PP2A family protein phosphatase